MRSRRVLVGVALALVAAAVLLAPGAASAHPLGNFTVNVYSGLRVGADRVDVHLVVDMAEIPTFQARVDPVDAPAYGRTVCAESPGRVSLSVDGRTVPVRVVSSEAEMPPGQGGLATLRVTCRLTAETDYGVRATQAGESRDEHTIRYRNDLYADRVGWREITAVGDGAVLVASDVPETSTSAALTAYPDDLLQSPLDQGAATLRARPGGPAAAPEATATGAFGRARNAFTDLVARRDLTIGFGLLAIGMAVVLGGIHAFAPGHGKTMMAAYLVGQKGTLRQAATIGLTVTVTHTAGVLILGLVLTATTGFTPERLYPWLGVASGLLVVGIGVNLLRVARTRTAPHTHAHAPEPAREFVTVGGGHSHSHAHPHPHPHDHADRPPELSRRNLLAMGLAGGMVPTPSALVVLLGAIALGRAWFGVVLVIAYGVGMAATLTGAGLLLVRARAAIERRMVNRHPGRLARLSTGLPVVTASVIVAAGLFLAVRGAVQL
ncbi:MAG: nickel/cobalt transporter [Acidimicrobiales bacterium]